MEHVGCRRLLVLLLLGGMHSVLTGLRAASWLLLLVLLVFLLLLGELEVLLLVLDSIHVLLVVTLSI